MQQDWVYFGVLS